MTLFVSQKNTKPTAESIDAEASEWFSLIVLGDPSPEERTLFEQWLQVSSVHRSAYKSFDLLWCQMADLPESAFQGDFNNKNISSLNEHIEASKTQLKPRFWLSTLLTLMQNIFKPMNGVIVASVLIGLIYLLSEFVAVDDGLVDARYYTGLGEIKTVALADGSQITLSAKSEIRVHFKTESRHIELLSGQAYFDIATQYQVNGDKLPFDIQAGTLHIQVLGTEFDVQKHTHKTTVSVFEGRINVNASKQGSKHTSPNLTLIAGQRIASISPPRTKQGSDLHLGSVEVVDSASIASWRYGRLTYLDATLADVISDARRFHAGSITLSDAHLAGLRITTSFGIDEIENLALILESILPVKVYFGDHGRILISPKQQI